ncbi:MAG: hemin uptake protein HemP [Planctomycetota bacterium]|nr:MAG: hemin uptake protein HemP [Planctomycetota bacterium]
MRFRDKGPGREILKKDHSENQPQSPAEAADGEAQTTPGMKLPKIIRFDSLARCGDEVWIENNGQIYRLRRTRQGKLILTK